MLVQAVLPLYCFLVGSMLANVMLEGSFDVRINMPH